MLQMNPVIQWWIKQDDNSLGHPFNSLIVTSLLYKVHCTHYSPLSFHHFAIFAPYFKDFFYIICWIAKLFNAFTGMEIRFLRILYFSARHQTRHTNMIFPKTKIICSTYGLTLELYIHSTEIIERKKNTNEKAKAQREKFLQSAGVWKMWMVVIILLHHYPFFLLPLSIKSDWELQNIRWHGTKYSRVLKLYIYNE